MKEQMPGMLSETAYENLNAEMKQFYNCYKDAYKIKGEEVKKGQVRSLLCIEIICYFNWFRGEVSNICNFLLFLYRKIDNSISVGCVFSFVSLLTVRCKACILQRQWKAA